MSDIEQVKAYWNNRPCNIFHSPKELGTKEYFNEVSKRKYFVEPHIAEFANFKEWKGKTVLEVGCGIGTDAHSFIEAGAMYTGLDLSEKSLNIAKDRFGLFNLKGHLHRVEDEIISKVLPVQPYDLVYSFGVIHHTPRPKVLLGEIKKYMSKNSLLRIMLYAKNSWKSMMIDAGLDQPEAQSGCPIADMYSKEDVVRLLSDFVVISIKQDHIFPYKISKYKNYEYEKQSYFQAMPGEVFDVMKKNLGWHLLIEARLK